MKPIGKLFSFFIIVALLSTACQSESSPKAIVEPEESSCKQITYSYGTFGELGFDYNIVSVCPDGSEKQRLTIDGLQNSGAMWSPDGERIAFFSSSSVSRQLQVMQADGGNPRALTSGEDLEFLHALWMPDGQQIAFLSRNGGQDWQWQLVDIESAELQPFEDWPADPAFHPVAFSHSGDHLVYLASPERSQASDGPARQIYIQNRDGSNSVALTTNELDNKNPRWGPEDGQIAFLAEVEGSEGQYALYVVNADGSELHQVGEGLFSRDAYFDWSPDGQSLVIFSDHTLFTMDFYSGEILAELASVPNLAGQGSVSGSNLEQMGGGLSWQP